MNESIAPPAEELQPASPSEQAPPEELSLAEHEAQFNSGKKPLEPQEPAEGAGETPEQVNARAERAAQQARDQENGQFKTGKRRGKDAVKRIDQLTGRAKTAEERLAAAEAELAQLRTRVVAPPQTGNGNGHAPQPQTAQSAAPAAQGERFVLPAPPFDPEPVENDPRYGGDFTRYLTAVSAWNGRQAVRQMEFDRYVSQQQAQAKQVEEQILTNFATRVDAAKAKYDDFEDVAFGPTPIKKDTVTDIFLTRDDNGPEMLYYLHRPEHRQELDDLLKMPELQQVKFLTLLSQRLSSTPTGSTATTTSAASPRTIVLPPKPPNVVRTEAQRASGGPPTDRELSLSEHEQYFAPTGKRR